MRRPRCFRASRSRSRLWSTPITTTTKARVEVYRGDIKVAEEAVKLKKGENRVALKQTIDAGGLTPISARLKGYQDTLLDNNSDFALVSAAGKPRVLLSKATPSRPST